MLVLVNQKTKSCQIFKDGTKARTILGVSAYKLRQAKNEGYGIFGDWEVYVPEAVSIKSSRGGFRNRVS